MSRNFKVPGFLFSGVSAGLKKKNAKDLALIYSKVPASVVGSFTTNRVQAAPVVISKKNIRSGSCRAVIINSGNANACTGRRGLSDAQAMVRETARRLMVPANQVLICSTGKIGVFLPVQKVFQALPTAVEKLSPNDLLSSAEAILTTDVSVKTAAVSGKIGAKPYRIVGFAKGAGMIAPQMKVAHATMLAFIMTDALVPKSLLKTVFQESVEQTFNRVTVDSDTSTNDTAFLLANGLAGNHSFSKNSAEGKKFQKNLLSVMDSLARQMVEDGEGATKCVRIEVKGASNERDARLMAFAIANSPLVKTAFFGQDPNWGRVIAAAGRSGATLKPERADIHYDSVCVLRRGVSAGAGTEKKAKEVMSHKTFTVTLNCRLGKGTFWVYASDLTFEYVKINSYYRT